MKAIGYARVSSREQIDGTSLESQANMIRAYATMKGLELVDVLVDAGVSGGKPLSSRPEGSRLAKMVESGEVQAVIITKLDRGFRSASDCLINVEAWERRGVSLHILNLGGTTIDTSSPTGKFFITIMAGAAELERNLIKERCNEGRKARKLEGKRIGEVPFGWTLAEDGKTLLPEPSEQEALELIHRLKAEGASLRTISNELNRQGFQAKKGGQWTHGQVQGILRRAA
jgi:DNA invertase Pin-like site-specific DNA recombinase